MSRRPPPFLRLAFSADAPAIPSPPKYPRRTVPNPYAGRPPGLEVQPFEDGFFVRWWSDGHVSVAAGFESLAEAESYADEIRVALGLTLPPDGPVVTIIGSVGPCRFGSECLIAGFTIHNFDTQPNEFVCEFADGSRYTFRFDSQGVERACATGDPTGSITIEVAGVRSETFTRP